MQAPSALTATETPPTMPQPSMPITTISAIAFSEIGSVRRSGILWPSPEPTPGNSAAMTLNQSTRRQVRIPMVAQAVLITLCDKLEPRLRSSGATRAQLRSLSLSVQFADNRSSAVQIDAANTDRLDGRRRVRAKSESPLQRRFPFRCNGRAFEYQSKQPSSG